jgi:IclR family acetate operon transcriptional repressor
MARTAVNSSATHVFEVLRLVARTDEPLGVSEISRRLGLPASTVYRALITLEESGYLARYQNMPRYELGQMPQLLNRALVHRFRLHAVSRPHLRLLSERTGETTALTVPLGWYGLRLAGVYGSHDIYHRERLGQVAPLHEEVAGIAILAFLGAEELDAYRAFWDARGSGADLDAVEAARRDGVARAATGAALPVRNPSGEVLASLAISASSLPAASEMLWRDARDALEAEIAADPVSFDSPFANIPADEIVIDLGRVEEGEG